MNQLALSNDLNVLVTEILTFKKMAGVAVFEIGKRLDHIKVFELVHGQWEQWCEENLSISARQARKYIRVYDRFSNRKSLPVIGLEKLDMLTAFDDEELEEPVELPNGEVKKPIDMSQKEIEQHKQAQRLAEKRADEAEASKQQALTEYTQQQEALLAQIAELKLVKDSPETLQRITELEAEVAQHENLGMENVRLKLEMKRVIGDFEDKLTKRDSDTHSVRKLREALKNMITAITMEQTNAKYYYSLVPGKKDANEAVQAFIRMLEPKIQEVFKVWQEACTIPLEEVIREDE